MASEVIKLANDSSTSTVITDETEDQNARYIGASPNNYVKFYDSNIVWRIIGVFDGQIKLVSNGPIEKKLLWDDNGKNNWAIASLQKYLNGEYYEQLSDETKLAIDGIHEWRLGSIITASGAVQIYQEERGTDIYNGNPTVWIGRIAIVYPSDLIYAASGNNNVTREQCLNLLPTANLEAYQKDHTCWDSVWLKTDAMQWLLSPRSSGVMDQVYWGFSSWNAAADNNGHYVQAVFYLKSDTNYIDGDGSKNNPYMIKN